MSQFLYGFLAALVVPIIAIFAAGYIGLIPQIKPLVVQSGSMGPTIGLGSVVLVQKSADYQKGEVIAFSSEGSKNLVTHRIVSVDNVHLPGDVTDGAASSHLGGDLLLSPREFGATFQTKGDANKDVDPWQISKDQVVGKVVLYIPYLGYGVDFAKQPKGFILLIIIPASIIIYEELKVLTRELAKIISRVHPSQLSSGSFKIMIIVPLVGFAMLLVTVSGAYFLDSDKSLNNILGAANSFGKVEKVATGSATPTPATPSAQVSPSP